MKTQSEPRKVDLRIVDVVARYEMKRNKKLTGVVVYEVRPSEKTLERDPETPDYRVVFMDGVFQSCNCKAGLEWGKTPKCYHALGLIERERSRSQSPIIPDVSQKGTLSSNRGFSLMR